MMNILFLLSLSLFPQEDVEVYAHRGASTVAPEHTIEAYDQAINYGADYIEIDLRMTKDEQIVALHDETVDRTTNGEGNINDLTLSEIKSLDAGSWFSKEYKGLTVPTLSEIFDKYGNDVKYYIETRVVNGKAIMEHDVQKIVENHGIKTENIMFQSWREASLKAIDDKYTRIKLALKPLDEINIEHVTSYADGIGTKAKHYNRENIFKLKLLGMETHAFFFENEHELTKKVKKLGVDGIFTNYVQYQP